MKLYKYLLGLAIVALAGLSSCNTDVEGITYTPQNDNVSFACDTLEDITVTVTTYTVPIHLVRARTNGEYTVHYTYETDFEDYLSDDCGGEITFPDGEGDVTINVTLTGMEKGADYDFRLIMSEEDSLTLDPNLTHYASSYVMVHSDYTWVAKGKCAFIDYAFAEDENGTLAEDSVEIQRAKEKPNYYRLVSPWKVTYGDDPETGFTQDKGFKFYLDDDNQMYLDDGILTNLAPSNWQGAWLSQYAPNYCYIYQEDDYFFVSLLAYNVPSGGLYMGFNFAFQWDSWPGYDRE